MQFIFILAMLGLNGADLPSHEKNPVLTHAIHEGLVVGGARVKLTATIFRDGQSADEQRATINEIAGSSRGAEEMLQSSFTAPHRLRLRDTKGEGAMLRAGDLYFILHGVNLDSLKPDEAFHQFRGEPIEAGNMRFQATLLKKEDVKTTPKDVPAESVWYTHLTGRLLDRIAVQSTDQVVASRSPDSLIFATQTDPNYRQDDRYPNRWSTITLKSTGDVLGPSEPYFGGLGYLKLTRLKGLEHAVVAEAHFAYAEPLAWFDGAPILRSKFGLIAQDQVRRIRRELLKPKK